MNPLLRFDTLPLFDQIRPEHVASAIDTLLEQADKALQTVTAAEFPAEWAAMSRTLDVATEKLGIAWGAVNHLNSVADSSDLRAAYNAALPRVTEFWTRLGADERLYAKYKAKDLSPVLKKPGNDADSVARIYAMVENIDQNVGRLMKRLEEPVPVEAAKP